MPIPVTDLIDTTDPSDTYATHNSTRGKGGLHEVADITARNAITAARRTQGMLAYVQSEDKYYTLQANLTTWVEMVTGGGGGGPATSYYEPMLTTLTGNRDVAYVDEIVTSLAGEVMVDLSGNVMVSPSASTTMVPDFTLALDGDIMMMEKEL